MGFSAVYNTDVGIKKKTNQDSAARTDVPPSLTIGQYRHYLEHTSITACQKTRQDLTLFIPAYSKSPARRRL